MEDAPGNTSLLAAHDGIASIVRSLVGLAANVTAITALLVYFGWRRSETQAAELGIDESILGMSTRDYVLRSVGPVLTLLVGIAIAGLTWVWADRRLETWLRSHRDDRRAQVVLWCFSLAWLWFPVLVVVVGYFWRELAFVLFPASIGIGTLLCSYGSSLRSDLFGRRRPHQNAALAFVGVIVAVCVFWTASNYAEILGSRLAANFSRELGSLTGVVVYSKHQLHLDAPGSIETVLVDEEGAFRYRYAGLRLLEHTGGNYFLVSDQWSPQYGVVVALPDDDATLRLEFVRDRR